MIDVALAFLMAAGPIAGGVPSAPGALPSYNPVTSLELSSISKDVRRGRDEGSLSRKQAKELRREVREIATLEQRYGQGGLSDTEAAELRARIEVLRALTRGKRLGTLK
jgi:hypothetical protein